MTTGQQRKTNILIIFTKIDIHNKREVFGLLFFLFYKMINNIRNRATGFTFI